MFDDLLDLWMVELYNIAKIHFDIRGWEMIRMQLVIFLSLVGIYIVEPKEFEHHPLPEINIHDEKHMIRFFTTNLGSYEPFDIYQGNFLHF